MQIWSVELVFDWFDKPNFGEEYSTGFHSSLGNGWVREWSDQNLENKLQLRRELEVIFLAL